MSDLMNLAPAKANAGFGDKYFNDGDVVSCIIIEERVPTMYKEEIKELNAKRKTDAQLLGKPLTTVEWNKLFGIEYSVAIVRRRNKEGWEDTIGYDGDNIIIPKYSTFAQIKLSSIPKIYKEHKDFNGIIRGISKLKGWINKQTNKFQFEWADILPNPWNCRDRVTKRSVVDIKDFEREEFQALLIAEEIRVAWAERWLKAWEEKNNEQCLDMLKETISRTYLLCNVDDSKYTINLIPPQVGLLFQCRVTYSGKDNEYLSFEPMKWNKDNKVLLYGSSMKVHPPTIDEIDFANKLLQARNANTRDKIIEKNTKPTATTQQDTQDTQQETVNTGDDEW